MPELRWTPHARERAREMGVTPEQVVVAVKKFERTYRQDYEGDSRRVYQKGDLAVIVSQDHAIVTVVWRDRHKHQEEIAERKGRSQHAVPDVDALVSELRSRGELK